jgi:hypothetical protein
VPLLLLGSPFFPIIQDDWHLLAHAMASDFSVAREKHFNFLMLKKILNIKKYFWVARVFIFQLRTQTMHFKWIFQTTLLCFP